MVLTILIFLLFIIAFVFAKIADKKRDKFQFDMLPNEKILQVENDITFFGSNKECRKTGLLYLTNKRLVFFRYKFGFLQFIPLIGSTLVAVFLDKQICWELPVNQIITYHFKPTVIKTNNGTRVGSFGETKFLTINKENVEFDIPLKFTDYTKSDLLVALDTLLSQKA
ncbi:MAG: hypothetical protein IPP72_10460 [Chitinophagaceae bacterium]|nr:hypothetical protein [Chitinophagaceae bacterium]